MLGRRSGPWLDASTAAETTNGVASTTSETRQQRVEAGTRTMADSFTMAVLPFSTDGELLEKFKNTNGGLREWKEGSEKSSGDEG